jgi:prepilin-type N-terminal cleavage/methylation domain-containing protein
MSRANDHRRTARREPCHPEVRRGVRSKVSIDHIADVSANLDVTRSGYPLRPKAYSLKPKASPHRGLTLIEMLMATAITLLMMAAIVNLFATMTGSISNRRAVIELNAQLRQVRQRLALDLAGCTVPSGDGGLMPWRQRPGEAIGYFEIVEGVHGDHSPSALLADGDGDGYPDGIDVTTSIIPSSQALDPDDEFHPTPPETLDPNSDWVTDARGLGDYDDVLALTVRSLDQPFVAEVNNDRVESNLAEVIWYASENPPDGSRGEPGLRKIYRRVFLIAPWITDFSGGAANVISSHDDPSSGNRVANTLADLTRREFRAAHQNNFPHEMNLGGNFYDNEFTVLSDALAFDVRVYDPGAPLLNVQGVVVQPTDRGWGAYIGSAPIVGFGAYVDLGWDGDPQDYFPAANAPATSFQLERQVGWHPRFLLENSNPTLYSGPPAVYDTWTWHYENDGVNQDNVNNVPAAQWRFDYVDTGRNGIDDNGINGVDDAMERETSPPYPVPLRGVKVILRTYERDARQVREVSVTNSFVP